MLFRSQAQKIRTRDNTGTCPVCFRNIKLKKSSNYYRMVDHGFEMPGRGWGRTQGCFGEFKQPFELSSEGTEAYIEQLQKMTTEAEDRVRDLVSGKTTSLTIQTRRGPKTFDSSHEDWAKIQSQAITVLGNDITAYKRTVKQYKPLVAQWSLKDLPKEGDQFKSLIRDTIAMTRKKLSGGPAADAEAYAAAFNLEVLKLKGYRNGWRDVPSSLRMELQTDLQEMVYDNMGIYTRGQRDQDPATAAKLIMNRWWDRRGTTMNLRDQVIKLAYDNPGPVREALLPILKRAKRVLSPTGKKALNFTRELTFTKQAAPFGAWLVKKVVVKPRGPGKSELLLTALLNAGSRSKRIEATLDLPYWVLGGMAPKYGTAWWTDVSFERGFDRGSKMPLYLDKVAINVEVSTDAQTAYKTLVVDRKTGDWDWDNDYGEDSWRDGRMIRLVAKNVRRELPNAEGLL